MNLRRLVLRGATHASPIFNDTLRYFFRYKRLPDRENPKTFSEKLIVLKETAYSENELIVQCSDKLRVRDFVLNCGCGGYLNELYAYYDLGALVDWDTLPNQFVMKLNTGAGYNFICSDKLKQLGEAKARAASWKSYDHTWLDSAEMHYEQIRPALLFEKYLNIHHGGPEDYKVYCFNGTPQAILVMAGRSEGANAYFMSLSGSILGFPNNIASANSMLPRNHRVWMRCWQSQSVYPQPSLSFAWTSTLSTADLCLAS